MNGYAWNQGRDMMKCKTVIDKTREEEVIIYAHERNETVEAIEKLVLRSDFELIGYSGKSADFIFFTKI